MEKARLPTPVFLGFPCGSAGQESSCSVGDLGSIPRLGRSPGEGKDYPFQYSGLDNSMDCIAHGVMKSQTQLSDFHFPVMSALIRGPCKDTGTQKYTGVTLEAEIGIMLPTGQGKPRIAGN